MNRILVLLILLVAGIGLLISLQPVQTPVVNVAPELQDNQAAKDIAALGIVVEYEELGENADGYTVRGQTWFYILPDGSEVNTKVILDDDVDPNSYDAYAILYHELGHIVNEGAADTEAAADDYAASRGYVIVDAYHGIH